MEHLKQQLKQIVEVAGGSWAIVLEDLDREEKWNLNGEQPFYAASVIKLPIMAAVFAAADKGKFKLGDCLTLKREDLVGGSGVLQHLSPGIELPIYDLAMLMIIQSDNTATNILIDLVGKDPIREAMQDLGMSDSAFYTKLMTVPVDSPRNSITASDVSGLLKKLALGKFVSLYACEQMIDILKKQQVRNGLPGYLPDDDSEIVGVNPEWEVANKSGWVTGIHHDAGIFYVGSRTMIVTAFSKGCDTLVAPDALAKIGKAVYTYMKNS
ncbi:MAG TPA: serine hydrolase [Bacillales bacterium]|nr:serine hydrolase [Bacillales bacterium]